MLIAINKIRDLEKFFLNEIVNERIIDFRIALKLNMDINVYLLVENLNVNNYTHLLYNNKVTIEQITSGDCKNDGFYDNLFKIEQKINFGLRRRLSNLLEINENHNIKLPCPIISFYSYKGGVGRSTTLAGFAAHYAYHYKKKVVILDCDFEAPGFSNYFDLTSEILSRKSGVVEYLLDRQFLNDKIDLYQYLIEVSKEYSGDGEIHIMPSGNVSDEFVNNGNKSLDIHRSHFLEALARIDLTSDESILFQFNDLFHDIKEKIKPDLILIDSRTGFNDIFGVMAFHLSSLVVGFFGNNIQTQPGLHFFIDSVKNIKNPNFSVILINAIISEGRLFDNFKDDVNSYLENNLDANDEPLIIEMFPLNRFHILERIGTKDEYKPDFINLIRKKSYSDFNMIFEGIIKNITDNEDIKKDNSIKPIIIDDIKIIRKIDLNALEIRMSNNNYKLLPKEIMSLKCKVLENLKNDMPRLYGEEVTKMDENYINQRFYFRECMKDVFNRDKFLILGSKGTGKTFLYNALKEEYFISQLQQKARKIDEKYTFINIISTTKDKVKNKRLEVARWFKISEVKDTDFFFNRFWMVYIWNSIFIESDIKIGFKSKYDVLPITNDEITKRRFLKIIESDTEILKIENELKEIDSYLKNKKQNLIILFDQLDNIVKPIYWDKVISPLINFFRSNQYLRILPKILLRSDLFEKLGNLNNKQELKSQSISIEWSQEEIFAFFFKILFAKSKSEFYNVMNALQDIPSKQILNVKQASGNDNQVPLDKLYLKPLVDTFFGKWADGRDSKSLKYGESYDWFYKNLKNADDTISLRPFIDLLNESITYYFKSNSDRNIKPILSSFYYANSHARKYAVKRHFEDLAEEEGNKDLLIIFDYIDKEAPLALRKQSLKKGEFESLIANVIKKYNETLDNKSIEALRDLLIVNGIISVYTKPGGYTSYNFALLYKYYLGLSNKRYEQNTSGYNR